jgi:hypothetical protein
VSAQPLGQASTQGMAPVAGVTLAPQSCPPLFFGTEVKRPGGVECAISGVSFASIAAHRRHAAERGRSLCRCPRLALA